MSRLFSALFDSQAKRAYILKADQQDAGRLFISYRRLDPIRACVANVEESDQLKLLKNCEWKVTTDADNLQVALWPFLVS